MSCEPRPWHRNVDTLNMGRMRWDEVRWYYDGKRDIRKEIEGLGNNHVYRMLDAW